MNKRLKIILLYLVDIRSIILAFAVFNFILIWMWDRNIGGIGCVVCPWFHPWTYSNEPTVLLVAAVFLRVNRWWGNTISFALAAISLAHSFISCCRWKILWLACVVIGDSFAWTIHTSLALGTANI